MNIKSYRPLIALLLLSCLIIVFLVFYGHELNPHHSWPPYNYLVISQYVGSKWLIYLNVIWVAVFLLSIAVRGDFRETWLGHGVLTAFLISLFLEMFGLPFLMFLFSTFGGYPGLGLSLFKRFGHWPVTIGFIISALALALLWLSWVTLYFSKAALVTGGVYSVVRHPQYLAFILFGFGWLLHWTTAPGLFLFPFLVGAYIWAAKAEDKRMLELYGDDFLMYAKSTRMFFPTLKTLWLEKNG